MSRRRRSIAYRTTIMTGLAATLAAVSSAHDTWILPIRAAVAVGETATFEATSAMHFPDPDVPVSADRVVAARLRIGRALSTLDPVKSPAKVLRFAAVAPTAGIATAWMESRPREIDMEPDQVEHYLGEIGALDTIGKQWNQAGRPAWHETYSKVAKTFVRIGAGEDRSWADPVDAPFEMVPEDDPTRVQPGGTFAIRVLENGAPVPDLGVGAVAGGGEATMRRTDKDGRVSFLLDRTGPWLLRAVHIQPDEKPGAWRSRFTTLTLFVANDAVAPVKSEGCGDDARRRSGLRTGDHGSAKGPDLDVPAWKVLLLQ